jgi:hypothetical protein
MKTFLLIFILLSAVVETYAQKSDSLKNPSGSTGKTEISGYIQFQYQDFYIPDSVGGSTAYVSYFSGGSLFNASQSQRFTLRRGRIKVSHRLKNGEAVISTDVTERGFSLKDAYISIKENQFDVAQITAGVFSRPFGNEVMKSSSERPSPERSRVVQTIFPRERDMGVMLSFSAPEKLNFDYFDLKVSLLTGNSVNVETDSYLDVCGRLGLKKEMKEGNWEARAGVSYYNGYINHIYEPVDTISSNTITKFYIYKFGSLTEADYFGKNIQGFSVDSLESKAAGQMGSPINRRYLGIDAMLGIKTPFGKLSIEAEYIKGTQPAKVYYNNTDKDYIIYNGMNSFSPTGPSNMVSWPMYDQPQPYNPVGIKLTEKNFNTFIRNFSGGYISLVQDIAKTGVQFIFKYDWYDPNTDIAGADIKLTYTAADSLITATYLSPADVMFKTYGFGGAYQLNEQIKITAYYEVVKNEITSLPVYKGDIKLGRMPSPSFDRDIMDNVLTLRIQYKF